MPPSRVASSHASRWRVAGTFTMDSFGKRSVHGHARALGLAPHPAQQAILARFVVGEPAVGLGRGEEPVGRFGGDRSLSQTGVDRLEMVVDPRQQAGVETLV